MDPAGERLMGNGIFLSGGGRDFDAKRDTDSALGALME